MTERGGTAEAGFWGGADGAEACQQFRTLVNAVDDGIYQLDARGRFIAVNEVIVEMTGYSRDALLGESVSRLVDEADVERIEREIAARLETGTSRDETFELPIRTADGGTVPCELRVNLLVENDELQGTVGVVRGVSERERAETIAEHRDLERELRERERRLSSLIDNVPGMVYRCRNDRDWPMEFVSDACEDVTGYAADALERGDVEWGDLIFRDDREMVWNTVQEEAGDDGTFSVTYRIETATGERRWVSDRGRGIFDDGDLVEIEGIISDITDRKRAEQRLAEQRDMFADGPAVVFRWEPDDEAGWPVEYVSRNVEDVFGYAPEELESGEIPYTDLLFDEEIDRIAREVEANSDGSTERFSHEPYRVRTADGEVKWVKDTTKIVRDESGEIANYLGYLVDITERKERERELTRYEAVVETVNDGVYVVDDEGRFTMVNDAYAEMTGYDRDELLGEHVSLVVDEDVVERAQSTEAQMRRGDSEAPTVEAELRTADGERLPAEATFALLPSPDGPDRRVGVVRDISDRRERERELQRKERRYEAVFEDPNILVGLLDPDGTVLDINGTAMEYVDATLEDVTGAPFWETPWWGGQAAVRSDVREWTERAADGEYVDFEADLTRPDGERYTLNGYFRPVTDEHGEVVSIIVSDRDVTERKRRERELAESERRYRALVENYPNGAVALIDGDLRYKTVGGDPTRTADLTVEEIEGRPVTDVLPPELADELVPRYEAALEGTASRFDLELDGGHYHFLVEPVRDDDGEVFAALGMSQDVTEREEAKRRLEESERRYRALAENYPNGGVGVFDEDLRYTLVTGTMWDDIEPDAADLEGETIWEGLPPETAADVEPVFRGALEGETCSVVSHLGGRTYRVWATPLRDAHGEITGGQSFALDITDQRRRERELEESERRYRTLVEHFPNGSVGLYDENLTYDVVGGELLDDLELSPDDVVDTSIYARYPDELVDGIEPNFRAVFEGESNTFEIHLGGRDILAQTLPVRNADGEIYAGMVLVQDVTERKERERELERALDLLNKTERIADVAGWEVDPATNEPYWTDHLFNILDVDYDEQPSLDQALDVYHTDEDRAVVEDAVEEALETGDSFDVEVRFPRPAGDVGWLRVKGDPEIEGGEVVSLRGAVQDVTERKEREQALQESRNQLRALIDVLPVAVFVAEADGEIVEWNEAAEEIWGGEVAESESVAEYEAYDAWWADSGEPLDPREWPLARALQGEEVTDPDEIEIEGFDGERRIVLNHGTPVRNADGEVTRAVVTLVDITERKEYQRKLEESNERLEQFAYAASHDLQEPLRMVSSYLQLLEHRYADDLDEDGQEFVEFAVDGAERMRDMIEALLEYSRVETQGEPFEPVDLGAILHDVLEDLRLQIEESDAEITSESLPRVDGDADQLRQVFQNLLDNAIEYSGDAPPRVDISAERSGDRWRITVSDRGIGIEPDYQDDIFEVFNRLHGRDEHAGAGIGLALCSRIVERHGGDISVDSDPGEGATFAFTLPAADGPDPEQR